MPCGSLQREGGAQGTNILQAALAVHNWMVRAGDVHPGSVCLTVYTVFKVTTWATQHAT